MNKTTAQPLAEETGIFLAEEKFLNQEPNEALYYINGKIIAQSDSGDFLFEPLSIEKKEFFVFGAQLEAENLLPISELTDEDREQIFKLNELNKELSPKGIFAVTFDNEKVKGKEVYYAIITHAGHSENTYFKIPVSDLQKMNSDYVDEMLSYNEERNLENPYKIQLDGDMMLAY